MRKVENMNAPNLWGWAIGAAAGLVAFGALVIIGEFDLFPAAFLAGLVAAVAGLILGMPWGAGAPGLVAAPLARAEAKPATEAEPKAPSAPVAEAMTQPAAFVSAPLAADIPAAKPAALKAASGPERLKAPRSGKADDLKQIEGIGPAMEKLLNELGFYHYDQIASWTEDDIAVVDGEMKSFKGRITRDRWVAQARIIVTEGLEAFRERAKTNNY
jgi:predicted flap endonuclease-1-like 5' DNA nuclease